MKKLVIISLLIIISISFAQRDSIDFHYMGEFFNTYVYSYCLHEDLLYCQTSIGLEVFELNDELQMQKVAEYEYCDTTHYIKYYDGKIYLFPIFTRTTMCQFLESYSLTVLDVSDLDSIYEYGYYDHFGSYSSYSGISTQSTIYGDTLVCIEYDQADTSYIDYWISMYHLGDSILAEELMTYPLSKYCVSISFYDKYAFIVDFFPDSTNDILIVDFSDPTHLVETNFETENMHNLYNVINDSILYVLSTDSITYKISSYNISDPDTLILLAEIEFTEHSGVYMPFFYILPGKKPDIEFNDSLMFIGFDELHVINISDPDTMYIVMEDETIQKSFFLYDDYFVHTKDYEYPDFFSNVHYHPEEMKFYDFTESDSLELEKYFPFYCWYYDIFPDGNTFFAGNFTYGYISGEIIDSNIVDVDFDYSLPYIRDVIYSIDDDLAAINSYLSGTYIVDISDSTPVIMSSVDTLSMVSVLNDNNLYVISDTNGIVSYDISDPTSPVFLDNLSLDFNFACEYDIYDNYLFLTYPDFHPDSIIVIDISDPSDLVQIIPLPDSLDAFKKAHAFTDRYIYSEVNDTTIGVYLFEDLYSIREVLTFDVDYPINDLEIHDNYLYVATNEGLYIYDTWFSRTPAFVTFLEGRFEEISVGDRYLFEHNNGLDIYEIKVNPIYELYPGWNLVSFPYTTTVIIEDELPTVVPGANFIFNTTSREFDPTSTLYSNRGFFLLSLEFGDYEFDYTPVSSVNLNLHIGWNLIGGPDADIPADILTSRDEIIGPIYGYSRVDNRYEASDTLRTHKGYWILATDSVEVTIP